MIIIEMLRLENLKALPTADCPAGPLLDNQHGPPTDATSPFFRFYYDADSVRTYYMTNRDSLAWEEIASATDIGNPLVADT